MALGKTIGLSIGQAYASYFRLRHALMRQALGPERAWTAIAEHLATMPGYVGLYTRFAFYRRELESVGDDAYIGFMSVFSKPQASVGRQAYIGRFCSVGWAIIGQNVMLADGVQILSGRHQHGGPESDQDVPLQAQQQHFEPVRIGDGAWLGAGSIIMADVGAHAVVGAGAVVVKPVAAHTVVGGVPAKLLSQKGSNTPAE